MFILVLILCTSVGSSGQCIDGKGWTEVDIPTKRMCDDTAAAYHTAYPHAKELKSWCIEEKK